MKKYLLGVFAIAVAIAFSAFTTKNEPYYLFSTPSTTDRWLIEAPEEWILVGEEEATCPDFNPRLACEVLVHEDDTEITGLGRKIDLLKVMITAQYNWDGGYFVGSILGTENAYKFNVPVD